MYLLTEFISVHLTDVLDTSKIHLKVIFSFSRGDFLFLDETRRRSLDEKQSCRIGREVAVLDMAVCFWIQLLPCVIVIEER